MSDNTNLTPEQIKFGERLNRMNTAIALGTPDRVPVAPFFASWIQRSKGSSYKDIYYNYEKAGQAAVEFYAEHQMCDCHSFSGFTSGKANEIAGSQMIDWPGKPGTLVPDFSSHQVIELELMTPDEYPEMLDDFTGFMIRKYIPRAYSNLKGLAGINPIPAVVLNTGLLGTLYSPEAQEAYARLAQIAAADAEAGAATGKYMGILAGMGFPGMLSGITEAPYDILGDYFRGTMGIFEDLVDEDMQDYIEKACYMFADQQIAALQYFRYVDMPVKRVFVPLHKAMDGFMNAEQYERLYWKPLKKIMLAMIDMGVTPLIYTEGPYNSRLEQLTDVPKGKVWYHFERVDMKEAKRLLGGIACISGNLSISQIEFGRPETVRDLTKKLLDDCAPGGGYIFDFDGSLENAKQENLDAMFEVLDVYGKY